MTALLHDAQEIAILGGEEKMNIAVLNQAFRQRAGMLRNFINTEGKKSRKSKETSSSEIAANQLREETGGFPVITEDAARILSVTILSISAAEKEQGAEDVVGKMQEYITVEEIAI